MNRKKKTEKIAAEALLIIILAITVLLIVATGCHSECTHDVSKNNVAEEWNNHVDSVLRNKIKQEYHGKEGKSEYGEYTPSDEYKMWVGENGDTIWE